MRRRADSLGVAGWAHNRDDGAVEAVFEGDPEQVESIVSYCRAGPGRAEVENLEVLSEPPEGLSGFAIR